METLTQGQKNNTTFNFELYNSLSEQHPHLKIILDEILKTPNRYALHNIWNDETEITFYFYQSFQLFFNSQNDINILLKYKVLIQSNFTDEYNFSISINK